MLFIYLAAMTIPALLSTKVGFGVTMGGAAGNLSILWAVVYSFMLLDVFDTWRNYWNSTSSSMIAK